jgi:hypothetical protein
MPMSKVITALRQKTDHSRWADTGNILASWESRTQRAAALVPKHTRVIEFGAGNRVLERYLDRSCTYVPSDIVDRGPATIVCDLNRRPLPDLSVGAYDVAVLMGVLEYMRDMPSVLDWFGHSLANVALCCRTRKPGAISAFSSFHGKVRTDTTLPTAPKHPSVRTDPAGTARRKPVAAPCRW